MGGCLWGIPPVETRDGGYVVAGCEWDAYLLNVDRNGDVVWELYFGGEGNESANAIDVTADGGMIMAGASDRRGASDIYLVKLTLPEPPARFLRGDCNGDGQVVGGVTDAVFLLRYSFRGDTEPPCLAACDANGDGRVTGQVTDAVYMLQHNLRGGPAPAAPYPECGPGTLPTDEEVGCETPPACGQAG